MRIGLSCGVVFLSFCTMSDTVLANGASSEFPAGGIVLKEEPDISIAREDLYLSVDEVRVHYVFHSGAKERRTIGFPLPKVLQDASPDNIMEFLGDKGSNNPNNYLSFKVSVNGVPVEPKWHEFAWDGEANITSELQALGVPLLAATQGDQEKLAVLPEEALKTLETRGLVEVYPEAVYPLWQFQTVYEWQQDFGAGETEVDISYVPLPGYLTYLDARFLGEETERAYCVDETFAERRAKKVAAVMDDDNLSFPEVATIGYILKTANYWSGPIGEFNLTVEDSDDAIASWCVPDGLEKVEEGKRWTARDFAPKDDLRVLYLVSGPAE